MLHQSMDQSSSPKPRLEVLPDRGPLLLCELVELVGLDVDRHPDWDPAGDEMGYDFLVNLAHG